MNNTAQKKKILVIPTDYIESDKIKVRIIELAAGLQAFYEVYILKWHVAFSRALPLRAINCIKDIFRTERIVKGKIFHEVEFPMLRRPLAPARIVNSYFLRRFIEREKIDVVFNGSFHMFIIPEDRNYKYIFDLGDMPSRDRKGYFERFIHRCAEREIRKADAVTAVSPGLAEYVKKHYGKTAHFIPNGAYIEKLRSVDRNAAEAFRRRYGLEDKWLIGYIGLIGPWVEVDLLVKAFLKVKEDMPDAALILTGPSPFLEVLRKKYARDDIVITGVIEGDISPAILALDVGVLPHEKNLFQDLAFHIKLIEYTSARKTVVSTRLNEVGRLNFPNIIQAEPNVGSWAEALKRAREIQWQPAWDKLVEPYDWGVIASRLNNVIKSVAG